MLEHALHELCNKAEEIKVAANALQCQKVEKLAGEFAYAVHILDIALSYQHPQPLILTTPMAPDPNEAILEKKLGISLDGAEDDDEVIMTDQEKELQKRRQENYQW